jgi:2-C-methyl-D-erythritol 4-phosphate cytidylyltransferase
VSIEFVAVLSAEPADRSRLIAGAASAVLTWPELLSGERSGDTVAVVFDQDSFVPDPDLAALLATLTAAPRATVVVTTRPVTDTLKLVNGEGILTGTADREDHRFVRAPIAARLGVLRSVAAELGVPTPLELLTALSANGATIISAA